MKYLLTLIITSLFFAPFFVSAQTAPVQLPENMQQAKQVGENAMEFSKNQGPGVIAEIWDNEVLPIWENMFEWTKIHLWDYRLKPWLENLWNETLNILKIEVQNRKPAAEKKLQTETNQVKQQAPQTGKSLWDKFISVIK